jgi:hypothetical protein
MKSYSSDIRWPGRDLNSVLPDTCSVCVVEFSRLLQWPRGVNRRWRHVTDTHVDITQWQRKLYEQATMSVVAANEKRLRNDFMWRTDGFLSLKGRKEWSELTSCSRVTLYEAAQSPNFPLCHIFIILDVAHLYHSTVIMITGKRHVSIFEVDGRLRKTSYPWMLCHSRSFSKPHSSVSCMQ